MSSRSRQTGSQGHDKAKWVKPVVKQIKAGSAEVNSGTRDDGDPGTSLLNS